MRHVRARQVDWLVFGAALGLSLPALVHAAGKGRLGLGLAVLPFATLPLLWRRTRPAIALAVLAAAYAASVVIGRSAPGSVGIILGVYAAARYGGTRLRTLSGAAAGAAAAAAFVAQLVTDRGRLAPHLGAAVAFGAAAAWVFGERAARLERDRDDHAQRAAEAERLRIARELHDVVTHHVTVIAVQAGAARATSRSRPERALEALGVIERTARGTLGELRTLLGVLRAGEAPAPAPLEPRPSLARLDELAAQARSAGIAVAVDVRGTPVELDAVVELGAYRVIQEALTNVMTHAPGSSASVCVDYRPRELRVSVADDGAGPAPAGRAGHGLVGMRERVEVAGGELQVGPRSGGGFAVEARFPGGSA